MMQAIPVCLPWHCQVNRPELLAKFDANCHIWTRYLKAALGYRNGHCWPSTPYVFLTLNRQCENTECTHKLLLLLHLFNGLFSRTTRLSRNQKGKPFWIYWNKWWWGGICISWTICKSFAPLSRQITTPGQYLTTQFYRPDAHSAAKPTASKHWMHLENDCQITACVTIDIQLY